MEKIGRNEPCPCGSGKKYKMCCMNKVPKNQYVYFGGGEQFEGISFKNGEVFLHLPNGEKEKPDYVFSQIQYTRENGREKIVNSINGFAIDISSYLASNFNRVFAIDTNTKQIDNNKISVCSIIESYFGNKQNNQISFFYRKSGILLFKNCPDNLEEKFSWVKFIKLVISSQNYNDKLKFAIITDHDFGNRDKYNNKELPLIRDFYLPDNFKFIYASSDTGKEFLLNKCIKKCDKDAKEILNKFKKNKIINLNGTEISIDNIQEPNFNNL